MRASRRIRRPLIVFICTWTVCTLVATGLFRLIAWTDRGIGDRLHSNGAAVIATVTRLEPDNHNSVDYVFSVGGVTYSSGWFGDGPDGTASGLAVGQPIHVFYDRTDPNYSCYCDPGSLYKEGRWWRNLLAGAFVSSVVAVIITVWILRRRPGARVR